jgi:type II restriction/modification system DNA methylase subunit YeeA
MTEVQYISDASGKPVGVIVPIDVWEKLEAGELKGKINELKQLFKRTQALPSARGLTDEDIAKEIEDYRNGK